MLRRTLLIVALGVGLAGCGGGGGEATATVSPPPGGTVQGYPADVTVEGPAQTAPDVVPTLEGYP